MVKYRLKLFPGIERSKEHAEFYDKVARAKRKTFNREDEASVSVWDYAGDEDFTATHHIFLTTDAVYIITFNAAKLFKDQDEYMGMFE